MSALAERALKIFDQKLPSKRTQREKIIWIQQHRITGIWARCSLAECRKWRYLKNIFDPLDIPDNWQCCMNPDTEYNSCSKLQSFAYKDSEVFKTKYTAGSLVWVNSNKYMRWPGMVDDDPEYAQFYWLHWADRNAAKEACMFHLVFFDVDSRNVTRQWFSVNELEPFTYHNSEISNKKQHRLVKSIQLAKEALRMNIFERLQKFSFARRFPGRIFSFGHQWRTLLIADGEELDYESDCTLFSSNSEDEIEDVHSRNKRRRSNGDSKRKRDIDCNTWDSSDSHRSRRSNDRGRSPCKYVRECSNRLSEYSETRLRQRNSSIAPENYSETNMIKRAYSVATTGASSVRMRRASSVGREYSRSCSRDRRSSSFNSSSYDENTSRRRGFSISRRSSSNDVPALPQGYYEGLKIRSEKNTKKRTTSNSNNNASTSDNLRASSVGPVFADACTPDNQRASSIGHDDPSKLNTVRIRRSSAVTLNNYSETNMIKRAYTAATIEADIMRRASSSVRYNYTENRNDQRRHSSSSIPSFIRKSGFKVRNASWN